MPRGSQRTISAVPGGGGGRGRLSSTALRCFRFPEGPVCFATRGESACSTYISAKVGASRVLVAPHTSSSRRSRSAGQARTHQVDGKSRKISGGENVRMRYEAVGKRLETRVVQGEREKLITGCRGCGRNVGEERGNRSPLGIRK